MCVKPKRLFKQCCIVVGWVSRALLHWLCRVAALNRLPTMFRKVECGVSRCRFWRFKLAFHRSRPSHHVFFDSAHAPMAVAQCCSCWVAAKEGTVYPETLRNNSEHQVRSPRNMLQSSFPKMSLNYHPRLHFRLFRVHGVYRDFSKKTKGHGLQDSKGPCGIFPHHLKPKQPSKSLKP